MGSAMAGRFGGAGFDLVVWNRDRAKAEEAAAATGATVADTAADAAAAADVVVTSLADDAALEAVYLGDAGVVGGIRAGSVAVDTSTVAPETVAKVGAAVDATGAGFLDCPVSGSVATVEAGALTVMAGGDPELVDRVAPVLSAIAKQTVKVGGRGAGAACKLAVNLLVHGLNVALSEAVVLAEKAGVDREIAYEVFQNGVGGAPFVAYKREAFLHPDETPVAFSLALSAKDLELITALGRRLGVPMAQAEAGFDIVTRAIDSGMGERDFSAVAAYLREAEG